MGRRLSLLLVTGLVLATGALAPTAGAAPPVPSNCAIVPEALADGNVGTLNTWFVTTQGCSTSKKPVQFKVVDGQIPPGTQLFTQGVSSGGITGTPTTAGTSTFTVRVTDSPARSPSARFRSRSAEAQAFAPA